MTKNIKLFCLPYAGGTSMYYMKWKQYLCSNIEVYPLEMAGRGKRFGSNLFENMYDVVKDLFSILAKELDKLDDFEYAFFGHSMGTVIIYELMKKIKQYNYKEPIHIFMSGRVPPSFQEKKIIHNLSYDEFKREISNLGGVPDDIINNNDVFDIFLPILRADYKIIETYKFSKSPKWNFDISVLNGRNDPEVEDYYISKWDMYTNKKCNFYLFDGGHFFINENTAEVVEKINNILIRNLGEKSFFKEAKI